MRFGKLHLEMREIIVMKYIFMLLLGVGSAFSQVVNRDRVDALLEEGEVAAAREALESYWKQDRPLTRADSLYLNKQLGIIYSASESTRSRGEAYFEKLLMISPQADLSDTYASHSIVEIFRQVKKRFQREHGGKSLVPSLAVFDLVAGGVKKDTRAAFSMQFMDELMRLGLFRVLERNELASQLQQVRQSQAHCSSSECFLELGKALLVDKIAVLEMNTIETVTALTIKIYDAQSGELENTVKKVSTGGIEDLVRNGLPELAADLQQQRAAWLSLTVQPLNASIAVDGTDRGELVSRIPLNPGKHEICAKAPGYLASCKEMVVRKGDALTHAFVLTKEGEESRPIATQRLEPNAMQPDLGKEKTEEPRLTWWLLGGMAAMAVLLAVLLNSPE